MPRLSVIVPVYNRPDEVEELLKSLSEQTDTDFETIIVEDGSQERCDKVVEKYSNQLNIHYFYKKNEKPAIARNYGMNKASGDYFLFFDSDAIIPPNYMATVKDELNKNYVDAYGGPDAAHASFSDVQKAINYSMTSMFTTGGIRGGSERVDKFHPRSFNMGLSRKIYETLGGFPITRMHPGEDMVLSIEIIRRGFSTRLIKPAFVYHKRRTSLKQFFTQVYRFGKTRFIMSRIYPETFKIFFLFPTAFMLGSLFFVIATIICPWAVSPVLLFALLIFFDSLWRNRSLKVASLSVAAAFIQLYGYGWGFLKTAIRWLIFREDEYGVYQQKFYA